MDIIIKELTDNDYRAAKGIYREFFDREKFKLHHINCSWVNRSKPDSYGFFTPDNTLIGFVIASFHTRNGNNMYIDYIALDKNYRGKGMGSLLLKTLVKECYKNRQAVHLYPERPELEDWYQRHGFNESYDGVFNFHYYETRNQYKYLEPTL